MSFCMSLQGHEPSQNGNRDVSERELISRFGRLELLDDLIRLRASDEDQVPILAYPKIEENGTYYEFFTGRDLDKLVSYGASQLVTRGFKQNKDSVIALLTLSDMNMVITFLALSRLGYTIMMLSPRLSAAACVSLLEITGCNTILYGTTANIRYTVDNISRVKEISAQPLLSRVSLETSVHLPEPLIVESIRDSENIALILHSSGSTGTPKPLFLTHRALMTHPLRGPGLTSFNSLPWYHLHGLSTALQAMWMRKTAFMWNASLPLTATALVTALQSSEPESVSAVPYVLQLLVDDRRGIDTLRKCKLVTYGGAPCPDELGDRLVREGVRFGGAFGLTEAGLVAESISRPAEDMAWNYLHFFPNIRKFVHMKPLGDDLYECVYLQGHPALTASNSDDPPGSFHSKDIFTPHPTLHDRWKYITRLDDRITLMNGEKVLPLPIEGCIKQHPLVREAVVVGISRAIPGLLIFCSEDTKFMQDSDIVDEIWPVVQMANASSEQFSQISRDMIAVLPRTTYCPLTDKGSLIRAKVYAQFADIIDNLYETAVTSTDGSLELGFEATKLHLLGLCQNELGIDIKEMEVSFFDQGFDSLKALHLRRLILRDFKLRNAEFGHNIVFETGNLHQLAEHILGLQTGQSLLVEDELSIMQRFIEKYSEFEEHVSSSTDFIHGNGVILTGATGSLGAHILSQLLQDDSICVVYCFTRSEDPIDAVTSSLRQRGFGVLSQRLAHKLVALKTSLHKPNFGLGPEILSKMRNTVSLVVHAAWPVNFNLPLRDFEPHIQGLYNLIQFSLSVNLSWPALTLFCSSVSAVLGGSSTAIQEEVLPDLCSALDMGYGRSKLVGEHIVRNATKAGARAYSLRIGQISGDSEKGVWNDSESLPLMIRSALTLKALPNLETTCSWLPVDTLASIILDLARVHSSLSSVRSRRDSGYSTDESKSSSADETVYNLCNPQSFDWPCLLKELHHSGVPFEVVPFDKWLVMLQDSERRGEASTNPAVKLVDHYRAMYGQPAEFDSQPERLPHQKCKRFVTTKAERDSITFRTKRPNIIEDGILKRYLDVWLKNWQAA